ncbi:putative protein kinase-like domain [Phaeomoniella chlamydospora]|uniref:Protein kinase domain-containing protein n=1 Tax=Phaeomoniella chlamydospora TaxID=158046 RepID=A0A0G2G9A5_PHACM|nr:putative protein kinase-like domain [Phaeomoniella chlamydospora]
MAGSVVVFGSTSVFYRYNRDLLLKTPRSSIQKEFAQDIQRAFTVEPRILERLGDHPRIVKYYGTDGRNLILREATHGNLEDFIIANPSIEMPLRLKFARQAIESVAYVHSKGVIHQDLRPAQFLVDETKSGSLDLLLSDFGGSLCDDLGLDGGHLPDSGFFDPNLGSKFPQMQDLFSLGSVCFMILTGAWPFRSPGPFDSIEEKEEYEERTDYLFRQEIYPDVTALAGGKTVLGCWKKQYKTAQEALDAFDENI